MNRGRIPGPGSPDEAARVGRDRVLLGVLFLLLGIFYGWNILGRRLPRGHDTLSLAYVLEYLFFAQSAQGGGIPLWLPYSSHGSLTSWYVGMGGGFFHAALSLLGVREGTNALPLFHLGLLFDEVLLLLGTWTLGRTYFRTSTARFFVTASVVGSTFWAEQIWHNHRAVYALPMIWSLFHGFLEDGSRRKLFLALNLLSLQFLGSIPYTALMTITLAVAYVGLYLAVFRRRLRPFWTAWRPRAADVLILVATSALLGALAYSLTAGTSDVALHQQGRDARGRVSLEQFLSFAGTLDPIRYADLLLGLSPMRDFTLFFGVATVPLALMGIVLRPSRAALHLTAFVAGVFLLSLGYLSIVGMLAYYVVPPLHFYRYLCTAGVHVRIPLIFLAGLGIEELSRIRPGTFSPLGPLRRGLALLGGAAGVLALASMIRRELPLDLPRILETPVPQLGTAPQFDDPASLAGILLGTSLAALALWAVLSALARRPAWAPVLAAALVAIQAADLARWRVQLTARRTAALDPHEYALQEIRPLPFVSRRSVDPPDPERLRALAPSLLAQGAAYDVDENYLHRDPPASPYTSPFWMSSVDLLLRTYGRGTLDDSAPVTPAIWRGDPPHVRPPYGKVIGLTPGKLQVFSVAHAVESDERTAGLLNRPDFRGDVLLVAPQDPMPVSPAPLRLDADERVAAETAVRSFDANSLKVDVRLPAECPRAWLLYCDAWHPDWSAVVNGKPQPISRAYLAYKAVPLEAGLNQVEFRMVSPARQWTYRLAAANAAGWVVGVIFFLGITLAGKAAPGPSRA